MNGSEFITVLVSTSPRPSHPSTRILDQTILSVRSQLPNAPIILMCDGAEADPDGKYAAFRSATKNRYSGSFTVIEYNEPLHQSGMLETALKLVQTPVLLYLEDDWVFLPYMNMCWEALTQFILDRRLNYIKFHAQHRIHPLHEHMMEGREIWDGTPLVKTRQWSQNPHLASTSFYRSAVLLRCVGQKDYIEHLMHATVQSGDWSDWKMAIYNPVEGASMQVVEHIDGDQP